jgi:hypothetical protein
MGAVADYSEGREPAPIPREGKTVFEVARGALREEDCDEGMIADFLARGAYGERKYGTALRPHDGRRWERDAYEEALDGMAYTYKGHMEGDPDALDLFFDFAAIAQKLHRRITR